MPLLRGMETMVLHAAFARRDVKLRASSWGVAEPLIHVCDRPADIMIGIDGKRSDGAERIGAGLYDQNNGFGDARRLPAPRSVSMPTACRPEKNGFLPDPRVAQRVEEASSEAPFGLSYASRTCVGDMASSEALILNSRASTLCTC